MRKRLELSDGDIDWLVELMGIPTVSPFEGGDPVAVRAAQAVVERGAITRGFTRRRLDSPPLSALAGENTPLSVRQRADAAFLDAQPSLVVGLGHSTDRARRLVINFHVDTVGPHLPPRINDGVLHGRGAIDDKGPGVAAAVGVAAAFAQEPWLINAIEVLLASVPAEEGGALGTYGTRWLVDSGCVGRLNLFAEPTGGRVFDACSATMTPVLRLNGADSTDDHPLNGHNATLALGFLAGYLARRLDPLAQQHGAKLSIAGLHTGTAHNRVYGTGQLLLNIAYFSGDAATLLENEVESAFQDARKAFAAEYADIAVARRLLDDWDSVVALRWMKRAIPALSNRDPAMEAVLGSAGLYRHDAVADGSAFTCDAIWAADCGGYVAVCGPGRLDTNGAHTAAEHVKLADLDNFATQIRDLVLRFGAHVSGRNL